MTWSEVMSRITIYLTVVSALLVVLALTAQATGFGTPFSVLSIGFATAALVMGSLTAIRVNMASREDAELLRAMNRLRAGYLALQPEIARYLTTAVHDDHLGVLDTYSLGRPRSPVLHAVGSTAFFVMAVNALVAGTLGALVANAAHAATAWVVVAGILGAGAYCAAHIVIARRIFGRPPDDVRFPSNI